MNLEIWGGNLLNTFSFHTLGCKVNHYESEALIDIFEKHGYKYVDFDDEADLYVINSCTVTNEAARKSRQMARKAKRVNPAAKVIMIGCYSQVSPGEVADIDEVDYILGSDGKKELIKLLNKNNSNKFLKDIVEFRELREYEDLKLEELSTTTRAYIKIEDGCDQFCTYCIIPYARGMVRSRPIKSVNEQVKILIEKGVKEIVLTGTHLGAYGQDFPGNYRLSDLLEELIEIKGNFRIRISSIEVTEIDDKFIDLIAKNKKICSHIHLPLQSGSERILRLMNRPYTREEFTKVVDLLYRSIPDLAITTDIITGFPGMTEKDFNLTYNYIKKINFSRLHVFPFSAREGTPAARMKNRINGNIIKKYSNKLRELNKELMLSFQSKHLGKIKEILIEEKRDNNTGLLTGLTNNYIRVNIDIEDKYINTIQKVKLLETIDYEKVKGVSV